MTIGDVTLSTALYRILCDEAQQHLSTLDAELHTLEVNAAAAPSQAMVRAAHTLCGIHRTGGFPLLAAVAKALEQCLLGLEERGPPLPSTAQPVLARAVAGLRMLAGRVRSQQAFASADDAEAGEIVAELDALRQEATPASTADDSESLAARAAAEEDLQAPPPPPTELRVSSPPPGPVEVPFVPVASPSVPPPRPKATAPAPLAPVSELKPVGAARTTAAAPPFDETLSSVHDEVDEQVLPIFLEEAAELFPQAGEQLRVWQRNPANRDAAQALRRTLHTFKGSARMAGAMRLGELTHWMESRLLACDDPAEPTPELFDALDTDLDRLAFVLDRLQKSEFNSPLPWLQQESAPAAGGAAPAPPPLAAVPASGLPATRPTIAAPAAPVVAAVAPEAEVAQRAMLRVRADLIDRLVNEAGEVAIARARVEGELRSLKGNLLELTNSVIRLRSQVREIEIQAESQIQSRSRRKSSPARRTSIRSNSTALRASRSSPAALPRASTTCRPCSSRCCATSMTRTRRCWRRRGCRATSSSSCSRSAPCPSAACPNGSTGSCARRRRSSTSAPIWRSAAPKSNCDRSVLEKLVGPLEHLLRNALDHGIESREERLRQGKPETGEISLTVRQQGNEIAIEIADDGAGLDFDRIRTKARELGLIAADVEPTEARLTECIFAPGFSTASTVTQISGRGVGADVVRSDVAALGGPRRCRHGARQGNDVFALPAADPRGRPDRAGPGRRSAVGAAGADGRAGAADQGQGPDQPVSDARGELAEPEIPVLLPSSPAWQRRLQPGDAAL